MSTETHTEAAGLAEAIRAVKVGPFGPEAKAVIKIGGAVNMTSSERREIERIALSWLTARLTDDDVVEAAARAIAAREGSRCFEQELTWSADRRAGFRDGTRAALQAAADVIGGER